MAANKTNVLKKFGKFLRDCKSEIKKIIWPTRKVVLKNTLVVLTMVVIIGLFVFGLDTGLLNLLDMFMNVSK